MTEKKSLDQIIEAANKIVNMCVEFGNTENQEMANTRLFRLYAAYLVVIDTVTQGIKNTSSEFMAELHKDKPDIRKDHL